MNQSISDEKYYKLSSEFIKCKDGSKKFTKAQLNDDFCDCPDGSDEPGFICFLHNQFIFIFIFWIFNFLKQFSWNTMVVDIGLPSDFLAMTCALINILVSVLCACVCRCNVIIMLA